MSSANARENPPGRSTAIRDLVGGHARVVWVQDRGDGTDAFLRGSRLALMALDTDDGQGERAVLPTIGQYAKPLISSRGDTIVFSNRETDEVFAVRWDGSGLHRLGQGFALDTWEDPATRIEWVYIGDGDPRGGDPVYSPVRRIQLARPEAVEVVWDGTAVSENHFQVSRDGRRAAGQFPWPSVGIADLENGEWTRLGEGCWTSIARDGTNRVWSFSDDHRHLTIVDGDRRWTLPANAAPALSPWEVYHPRWSNDARFLVLTGPYREGGGDNRIREGGPGVEVWVGRFAPDAHSIAWTPATANHRADFFPDLWVDPATTP